jgi:hypothetical protein
MKVNILIGAMSLGMHYEDWCMTMDEKEAIKIKKYSWKAAALYVGTLVFGFIVGALYVRILLPCG